MSLAFFAAVGRKPGQRNGTGKAARAKVSTKVPYQPPAWLAAFKKEEAAAAAAAAVSVAATSAE